MAEKSKRLNLMNAKVNMDFLKNMPIKIPKLKSRKIFNSKAPEKSDSEMSCPEPIYVSRSSLHISTLSSLVERRDEPQYDFGPVSITDPGRNPRCARNGTEADPKAGSSKSLRLSERLSKQYKEFSEFKFKDILGKKTVVRSTGIEVANYSHRPEDVINELDGEHFEFRSLPTPKDGKEYDDDDQNSLDASTTPVKPALPKRSVSVLPSGNPEPNKSGLFKHLRSLSLKRNETIPDEPKEPKQPKDENSDNMRRLGIGKLNLNRQSFEEACNKAKTAVTHKIQKLKALQEGMHDPGPSERAQKIHRQKEIYRKTDGPVMIAKISYGTDNERIARSPPGQGLWPAERRPDDEDIQNSFSTSYQPRGFLDRQESDESIENDRNLKSLTSYPHSVKRKSSEIVLSNVSYGQRKGESIGKNPPAQGFLSRSLTKSSVTAVKSLSLDDSDQSLRGFGRSSLGGTSSSGSDTSSVRPARSAPPLPISAIPVASKRIVSPNRISHSSLLLRQRKARQPSDSSHEYVRSSSFDSNDSDSWIADIFKGPMRNQINLDMIREDNDNGAWSTGIPMIKSKLRKPPSVDIFKSKDTAVFDDFDEALKNVPTVRVPNKGTEIEVKPKVLVQQSSITDKQESEVGLLQRSETFNKLRSRFEVNDSSESLDKIEVQDTTRNIVVVNVQMEVKNVEDQFRQPEEIRPATIVDSTLAEHFATKKLYLQSIKKTQLVKTVNNSMNSDNDDGDDEVFHSLDHDDGLDTDSRLIYRSSTTKFLYTAEV